MDPQALWCYEHHVQRKLMLSGNISITSFSLKDFIFLLLIIYYLVFIIDDLS